MEANGRESRCYGICDTQKNKLIALYYTGTALSALRRALGGKEREGLG